MIQKNKGKLILSSVILLVPMVVGLLLWNRLPGQMPIHWNASGEIDDWGSKAAVVFLLPLFLLAIHWLCIGITCLDPKNKDMTAKMMGLVVWVCPFISLVVMTLTYAAALGYNLSVEILMPLLLGAMFLVMGNYLPKCKRNYTIGIKVSWALDDEENWNATHRFAGKVWVLGGAVMMATSVFGNVILLPVITLVMASVPVVYSYLYYRKHKKERIDRSFF